jgi:ADP-heptose:LPS heptosyltransferase
LFLPPDQTLHGLAESGIEVVLRKARPIRIDTGLPASPAALVLRWIGMGDVLMATPVIRRLRAELGEAARIDVVTGVPAAFAGNPDVSTVNPPELRYFDYDRIINLDRVYEADRTVHPVDAYMRAAFGEINHVDNEMFLAQTEPASELKVDWRRAIVIHAGGTGRNRRMPRAFWEALIALLIEAGCVPVIVGGGGDEKWPGMEGVADLTQRFTVQETAWIIEQARCFISSDTGVLHIAGTTSTPIVAIYTSVRPEHRMAWRRGQLGWRTAALVPDLHCVGCNGGMGCRRGDFACVEGNEAITPQTAFEAIMTMVGDNSI